MAFKIVSALVVVFSSLSVRASGSVILIRTHENSACYVYSDSVALAWQGEEVGGRDHLNFTPEITSASDLLAVVEAAKAEGMVMIPNGRAEDVPRGGDLAFTANHSMMLLNSASPSARKLQTFLDTNCAGE